MGEREDKLSEYEKERLKRIEENRQMLDHLFPDGTSLHINGHDNDGGSAAGRWGKEHTPEARGNRGGTDWSPAGRRETRTRCMYMCIVIMRAPL